MLKQNIHFILSVSVVFSLAFLLGSCNGEGKGEVKDFHLDIRDTLLGEYNASRPNWDWSYPSEGEVNLVISDKMIAIEYDADNSEELVTYFLQVEDKKHGLETGRLGRAEVIFLDRNLLVNSLEQKKTLHFSIQSDPDPDFLKQIKKVKTYSGLGLGARKIIKGMQASKVAYCTCEPSWFPDSNCRAGEKGAITCRTSNENGSCRVSCSGQMVACCDKLME